MINKNSIYFTITVTFIVSLLLISLSFLILYGQSDKREDHFMKKRDVSVAQIILRECMQNGISDDLKNNIKELNYTIVDNYDERLTVLNNTNLIKKRIIQKRHAKITFMNLFDQTLIDIETPLNKFILINNYKKSYTQQYIIIAIFFIIISSFILLYLTTIKKLKPLKLLQNKMKTLANENYDIDCSTNEKDEISQLANEFDKTVKKLKSIKESRNIFIRNIMHELKTPITKGKFIIALPIAQINNDKLQKVFYRLEALINEFAMIEKLISTKNTLSIKEYSLEDVIDNATDLLMCDEYELINEIDSQYENIKIKIDFNLFSIAIKNLIDNGIKYSTNRQITIKTIENNIIFENKGKALKYDFENYFEPFFKGDDIKSNQSFGLGLYIIKHILDAHNYSISYLHTEGKNLFTIAPK